MKDKLLSKQGWVILLICIISFFINNRVVVPDIMEARNMVTAREMVHDGNWLVPTMNGDLRLEKPPLPTWLTAVAEMISPDNLALQRAMAGFAAILLVAFFYLTAVQVMRNKRYAFISTTLLCTCYNIILMGRTASWDIYCHAFMMGAIYFLIKAFAAKVCSWKDFTWAGVFMGLSFMSKGPVSFYALLLPFLISYCYIYRPSMKGKWKALAVMIVVCLIVGCWWYAFIYLFHGDAMSYVADKESAAWINRNVRPWYYYWSFFLETGVWAILLLSSLFLPLWSKEDRKRKEYLFPLLWMLSTVVLLSLLPEKKNRYLLPVLMSAAYTMGYLIIVWADRLRSPQASKADKAVYRVNAWLVAVVVAVLPIAGYWFVYRPGYVSLPTLAVLSVLIWGIAACLIRSAVRLQPIKLVGGVLILFLSAECFMLPLLGNVINNPEMKSVSRTRDLEELKDVPFYYNQKDELRIELVYAAGRKIRPLDMAHADSVKSVLPCAILTHGRAEEELPVKLLRSIDTIYIGQYDDNRWAKSSSRYNDKFVYHITLLKKK